jgi:hypothetical protein
MTTTHSQRNPGTPAQASAGGIECLCPFCGNFHTDIGRPCRHCGTEDNTAARAAARKRVGPWFVLQSKNLAAPGMSHQALLAQIRGGLVTDRSVIRGPATGQLWRLAGKVRGISREFGTCYGCNGDLYPADPVCPHCQRPQSLPADIDAAAEPSPAPRTERVPPKQDLLTARDVAKAFSLGYGPGSPGGTMPASPVTLNDLLPPTPPGHRPKPTAMAAVTVAFAVACFGWIAIHALGGSRAAPAVADAELPPAPSHAPHFLPTSASPPPPIVVIDPAPAASAIPVRVAPRVAKPTVVAPPEEDTTTVTTASSELAPATDPSDDPKRLMAAGLAAESRGDYAAAVKHYEHIESLSSEEWPAGLKDRLSLARTAARGD